MPFMALDEPDADDEEEEACGGGGDDHGKTDAELAAELEEAGDVVGEVGVSQRKGLVEVTDPCVCATKWALVLGVAKFDWLYRGLVAIAVAVATLLPPLLLFL